MPFLFAHGINRFSHNIAYVILVQLNLFITLFVITLFWLYYGLRVKCIEGVLTSHLGSNLDLT